MLEETGLCPCVELSLTSFVLLRGTEFKMDLLYQLSHGLLPLQIECNVGHAIKKWFLVG